jgi:diadenosine tetraphosphate (Ap4A) HIT family hydrolase
MNEINATIAKLGYPETVIKEYNHWVVMFRVTQVTVGSLVVAAKSSANSLGELSGEVWSEFATVSSELESWLTQAFEARKFNYLALMMQYPNVHFHVIPRYDFAVSIDGHSFVDPDWPLKTELIETKMSDQTKKVIMESVLRLVK